MNGIDEHEGRHILPHISKFRQTVFILLSAALTVLVFSIYFDSPRHWKSCLAFVMLTMLVFEIVWNTTTSVGAALLPSKLHLTTSAEIDTSLQSTVTPPLVVPVIVRSRLDANSVLKHVDRIASSESALETDCIIVLIDFRDCGAAIHPSDLELLFLLESGIAAIASKYADRLPIMGMYRNRRWNEFERCWMGWERKRGKLVEFMQLTRNLPTSFANPCPPSLLNCRYIMAIDIDTHIEKGAVRRLTAALEEQTDVAIAAPTLETLHCGRERLDRWIIEPNFRRPRLHDSKSAQILFGCELFNGKGVIRVDAFLDATKSIPENCVLSHDHLEAILAGACSVGTACVAEPFPEAREVWERRQHRWFRGDSQVLPWGLKGRSDYSTDERKLPWQARLMAARIALLPCNFVLRYLAVMLLATQSVGTALNVLAVLVFFRRDGLADGILALARSILNGRKKGSLVDRVIYHVVNAALRSVGEIIYFQRIATIAAHATAVTWRRMRRGSRFRLIEWYPENPSTVTKACRTIEVGWCILLLAGSFRLHGLIIPAAMSIGWLGAALLTSHLPSFTLSPGKRLSSP